MPSLRAPALLLAALVATLAGCSGCFDHPATPVTFRVTNNLGWPIYVRDEANQAGTSVQRDDGGDFTDLVEGGSCRCEECASACEPCTCFGQQGQVRRLKPGESFERTWSGEYRESSTESCGGESVPCLGDRRAAQPGAYRVQFCYANSLGTVPPDKERFPADLPASLTCASADFDLPAQDVVAISTAEPAGCRSSKDCKEGELCQGGRCARDCLPNEVPTLGADWNVEVGAPDDRGFFTVTTQADGSKLMQGTGKVTSVRYTQGTTNLSVVRYGANGLDYSADLYYTLPGRRAVSFDIGDELDITEVEYPEGDRKGARAIVIKQAGALAVLADSGYGGPVMPAASAAPAAVSVDEEAFACNPADCGRRVHRRTRFTLDGGDATLDPGQAGELKVGAATYEAVAVANYADDVKGCSVGQVTPHVVLVKRNVTQ